MSRERVEAHPLSCPGWGAALGLWVALLGGVAQAVPVAASASAPDWHTVGQQGLLRVVLVPASQASDADAYQRYIQSVCPPEKTCFINFFTNSSAAVAQLPLPDAIAAEPTARFRRSVKNGVELFQWSCRLNLAGVACF